MNKDEIIEKLLKTFSSVDYPKSIDFNLAIAHRGYSYEPYNNGEKVEWNQINKRELVKYYDFIFFLNNDGIKYYLPTYIVHILNNNELVEETLTESLFMTLAEVELNLFNNEQIDCLLEFLIHCQSVIRNNHHLDELLLDKAMENIEKLACGW